MFIENREEYDVMMELLDDLMTKTPGSLAISVVAKLVEEYELAHFPIRDPTPEEAAAFRADQEKKPTLEVLLERVSDAERRVCAKLGHAPEEKMSAIICGRCNTVLKER